MSSGSRWFTDPLRRKVPEESVSIHWVFGMRGKRVYSNVNLDIHSKTTIQVFVDVGCDSELIITVIIDHCVVNKSSYNRKRSTMMAEKEVIW